MKSLIRRQSPALILAIIALIAALGGTAVAAKTLNKKKVKNIANNQITKRAPGLSVAHAATADKVGPLSAAKFDYRATATSGPTTIGTFGGFVLEAQCNAGPETRLFATSNSANALAKSEYLTEGATPLADSADDLDPGEELELNTDFSGPFLEEVAGTANYVSQGGSVTTLSYGTEDDQLADCQAWGTAFNS